MKRIIFLTLIAIVTITCKAQSPIINILDKDGTRDINAYYKDVNNLLNQYEGTYLYTNGTTSFKIVLVKKIMQFNGEYYEDLIIGEYQYIVNGVEIVNTLSELNTTYSNQRRHNIDGNSLISKNNRSWVCPNCNVNEKRLEASIRDASTDRYATIIMRKLSMLNSSGDDVETLHIKIGQVMGGAYDVNVGPPADFSLPLGELTLIKQ